MPAKCAFAVLLRLRSLCMPYTKSWSPHMRSEFQGSRFLRKGPKFPTAVLAFEHARRTPPEESSCQKLAFSWVVHVQLNQLAHCASLEHARSAWLPLCCRFGLAPAHLRASAAASLRLWSGLLAFYFCGGEVLKGTGAPGLQGCHGDLQGIQKRVSENTMASASGPVTALR